MKHGPRVTPENAGRFRVYFAGSCGKVKIGCSVRPVDRILKVGEWIPYPITMLATMPGTFVLEAALHRMFAEEWSHGEWFHASPRLLKFIDSVERGLPVVIESRHLSEAEDRRRAAIADKKRIARHVNKLPDDLQQRIRAVPKGQAIPADLLSEAWDLVRGYAA